MKNKQAGMMTEVNTKEDVALIVAANIVFENKIKLEEWPHVLKDICEQLKVSKISLDSLKEEVEKVTTYFDNFKNAYSKNNVHRFEFDALDWYALVNKHSDKMLKIEVKKRKAMRGAIVDSVLPVIRDSIPACCRITDKMINIALDEAKYTNDDSDDNNGGGKNRPK